MSGLQGASDGTHGFVHSTRMLYLLNPLFPSPLHFHMYLSICVFFSFFRDYIVASADFEIPISLPSSLVLVSQWCTTMPGQSDATEGLS